MFLRKKLIVAAGSIAFSALALGGCNVGANSAPPAADSAAQSSAASNSTAGDAVQSDAASKSNSASKPASPAPSKPAATDIPEVRAGVHDNEERVVFDFSNVPHASGLKLMSHRLNQEAPAWGGSGKPVEGMTGQSFVHVYVQITDSNPRTTKPTQFAQKLAQSAVVNDNSEGTAELTIGLSKGVDYEVVLEGEKVIVNMADGPMGR